MRNIVVPVDVLTNTCFLGQAYSSGKSSMRRQLICSLETLGHSCLRNSFPFSLLRPTHTMAICNLTFVFLRQIALYSTRNKRTSSPTKTKEGSQWQDVTCRHYRSASLILHSLLWTLYIIGFRCSPPSSFPSSLGSQGNFNSAGDFYSCAKASIFLLALNRVEDAFVQNTELPLKPDSWRAPSV